MNQSKTDKDLRLMQVKAALLEGRSKSYCESVFHTSYQTIQGICRELAKEGRWPIKRAKVVIVEVGGVEHEVIDMKDFITLDGVDYLTLPQLRRAYAEVCDEMLKDGSSTLARDIASGALLADGNVPHDVADAEDWLFPLDATQLPARHQLIAPGKPLPPGCSMTFEHQGMTVAVYGFTPPSRELVAAVRKALYHVPEVARPEPQLTA